MIRSSSGGAIGALAGMAGAAVIVIAVASGFPSSVGGPAASVSPPSASASGTSGHHDDAPPSSRSLRLTMERLLGHHAVLAAALMRAPADSGDDEDGLVDAVRGAMERNTHDLEHAIAAVHGKPAGAQFAAIWDRRVAALEAYSAARAAGSPDAMAAAHRALDRSTAAYGRFVARLAGADAAASDTAAADLAARTEHLLTSSDLYETREYSASFTSARAAYAAMFREGRALSMAAHPGNAGGFAAGFASQATDLRSELGRLFGEHAALAFDASRAVVSGSPSAEAAADALNANSAEIVSAVRAALGPRAALRVSTVWAAHVDALVRFAVAVADRDDVAQARARAALDRFPQKLGAVLPALAGGRVAAQTVAASLRTHDEQLLQQVVAYAAGDYATSARLSYDGYDHMFSVAGALATALEARAAGAAPRKGAHTGAGGMAR